MSSVKRPVVFGVGLVVVLVAVCSLWASGLDWQADPRAAYASEGFSEMPGESAADVSADMSAAREALEQKRYREAQRYLERVFAHDSNNAVAVSLLVQTADLQIDALLTQEKYHEAAYRMATTGAYVQQFAVARVEGGSRAGSMADVLQAEMALEQMDVRLRDSVAESAGKRIAEARRLANEAYRYFWSNDRGAVREGLRQARWVDQHFNYLDSDLQGEYFHALNLLRRRVSNSEWEAMLAEAGMLVFEGR